jgi:hypothetical protein
MNPIVIQLNGHATSFRPGDRVRGIASWSLAGDAGAIEIRLFWHTRGKGTTSVQVVQTQRIDTPKMRDQRAFEFTLPEGPYSFSGSLISLIWGIEAVVEGQADATRVEFVVSPTGREVLLGTAGPEANAGA